MRSGKADDTTEKLYQTAVKLLARRARSKGELRALLAKRQADSKDIERVLRRLREHGYLDDARFARSFVSYRLETELHGQFRVRRDLIARKVSRELAAKAVEEAYREVDEGALLRRYVRRKLGKQAPLRKPAALAALYRRLLRAGFASDTIVREIKKMLPSGPAEADPASWDELLDSLAATEEAEETKEAEEA